MVGSGGGWDTFRGCYGGQDIRDQFETINGMSVYCGGYLCDLDESDWDDPYDIASAEYVEQYNFDVPEGMELMVHVRRRGLYGSDIRENEETGLTHVCQTSLGCTRDELDTVDTGISVIQTMDPLTTMNTWADWCGSAFWTAFGVLPSEADGSRPMVAFSDRLFLEEELADTAVTANMLSANSYWKWGCGLVT